MAGFLVLPLFWLEAGSWQPVASVQHLRGSAASFVLPLLSLLLCLCRLPNARSELSPTADCQSAGGTACESPGRSPGKADIYNSSPGGTAPERRLSEHVPWIVIDVVRRQQG